MTGSVLKNMKKKTKEAEMGILRRVGLKNQHSYNVVDVREVILDSSEVEYLLFIRNPAGNFYQKEDEVWKGDWGPLSKKWTKKTRRQCNYYLTVQEI